LISRLLGFYLIFFGALGLGLALSRWKAWSPKIMRFSILLVEGPIFAYSFWNLDWDNLRQFAPIPALSVLAIVITSVLAPLWARRLLPGEPRAQGSFVLAAAYSNIGNTGGLFLCYLLYGLPGLALGSLFLLPYPLMIFTLGFGMAHGYARAKRLRWRDYLLNAGQNPLSVVSLSFMALGFLLNRLGVPCPAGLAPVADVFIRLNLGISCVAIGMTLSLGGLFRPWKPVAAVGVIKFLLTPLVSLLAALAWYGSFAPLPVKIILIQAAMPPAMYAVITANLFGLDRDLANSLWLSNTLLLVPVAAGLFLLLG